MVFRKYGAQDFAEANLEQKEGNEQISDSPATGNLTLKVKERETGVLYEY